MLRDDEIETMVGLLLADPEQNHQRIHSVMQPAVDRFRALSDEQQDEFRDVVTRFTRIYSFLSQVVSFTDVKLARDYLFCRRLSQLVRRESSVGVDLGDAVELTHLRMEKQWEGSASLDERGRRGRHDLRRSWAAHHARRRPAVRDHPAHQRALRYGPQ